MQAQKPTVALTFDDLPETGDLPANMNRAQIGASIVEALKAANAPQVYGFVNAGTLDDDDPNIKHLLESWREAGFLLGNHTFTHWSIDEKPIRVYEHDISRNEKVIRRLMKDMDWHWFRYPFLQEGATLQRRQEIRAYLKKHGYRIAEVTIDFGDSYWNDPYARCVATHNDAAIDHMKTMFVDAANSSIDLSQHRSQLLFHRDIAYVMLLHYGSFEAIMLPKLLDILKARDFKLVTLPEAESDPVYAIDPKMVNDGGTFLDDLMQASDLDEAPPTSDAREKELDAICR